MEVQSRSKVSIPISKKSSRRFLFDRRYGYVYDEWREPSEVALAYGRGMFCIVPLGKALFTMVSDSVNLAARQTIEVLEQPDQLSSRSLQKVNDLNNQLHQLLYTLCGCKRRMYRKYTIFSTYFPLFTLLTLQSLSGNPNSHYNLSLETLIRPFIVAVVGGLGHRGVLYIENPKKMIRNLHLSL